MSKTKIGVDFPPLSITHKSWLKDGGDREFRQFVSTLLKLCNAILESRDWIAGSAGLSGPQYSVLTYVAQHGAPRISDVADAMEVTSNFITTTVNSLEAMGLVSRDIDDSDRRIRRLSLTEKGADAIYMLTPARRRVNDLFYRGFSRHEVEQLNRFVHRLYDQVRTADYRTIGGHDMPQLRIAEI